jgi:hypothetical protein
MLPLKISDLVARLNVLLGEKGDLGVWVTGNEPMTDGPWVITMESYLGPVPVVVLGPGKEW